MSILYVAEIAACAVLFVGAGVVVAGSVYALLMGDAYGKPPHDKGFWNNLPFVRRAGKR